MNSYFHLNFSPFGKPLNHVSNDSMLWRWDEKTEFSDAKLSDMPNNFNSLKMRKEKLHKIYEMPDWRAPKTGARVHPKVLRFALKLESAKMTRDFLRSRLLK